MKAELSGRFNLSSENVISVNSVYVDSTAVNDEDFNELQEIAPEHIHFNRTNVHGQVSGIVREKTMSARRTDHHQKHVGVKQEQQVKNSNIEKREEQRYNFVLAFNFADRSLDAALKHDRLSGQDRSFLVKQIAKDLAEAIHDVHSNGRIHADIKPLNILRESTVWKLTDLDVSCKIGARYGMKLPSSAYCPPEVAKEMFGDHKSLQRFEANVAHDLWSFGAVLFYLEAGESLFKTDLTDNISKDEKKALLQWNSSKMRRKLKAVRNSEAKKLIGKLLVKILSRDAGIFLAMKKANLVKKCLFYLTIHTSMMRIMIPQFLQRR